MPIPISTPTVADLNLRSVQGSSSHEMQVVFSAPHPRTAVAATLANSQFTVDATTAVSLASKVPAGATHAELAVDSADLRWWDDGKTPTSTQGKPLKQGNYIWVEVPSQFTMIAQAGTATITVSYYSYA
jgi:hypothetical protein